MKVAALDLGSNTFLCLICEVQNKTITDIYYDEVQVVRLGQDLAKNKKFHPEALARAKKTLTAFKAAITKHQPEKVLAMATSASRDAENKEELFKICAELDIPLKIIPGAEEAQITFLGAISGSVVSDSSVNSSIAGNLEAGDLTGVNTPQATWALEHRLVVDIGGGSTEYIYGKNHQIIKSISHDIGCVRLTERFIHYQPTSDQEIESCRQYIREKLSSAVLADSQQIDEILAVAGTPTALVVAELGFYDTKKIDGYNLTLKQLKIWLDKFKLASVEEKIKMGIPEGRADVILVGVLILLETLQLYGKDSMTVSTRGVRHGVALSIFQDHLESIK